ncbi:MAG: carbonic anhydrase [Rhodospirillales bacterium]|jgi:carbonic anhydrase|nr:carbonic anhydrase [Rhodospirillales bacterium]
MDSISKLRDGFRNFREGKFQEQRVVYENLVDEGQKPKIALVACSDSRVDPAMLLQADPGDLFVIRNVANLVPPHEIEGSYHGTSAALEYAVLHLEVEHLIVLGHAHCGGVRTLFNEQPASAEGNYFIKPWMNLVKSAHLRVEGTMPDASDEMKARVCEQSAVLVSLENLMTFPCIRQKVGNRELSLHGWHVDIRSCTLQVYDPVNQNFEAIE